MSNANIIKNADGLMSTKSINQDVEWVRETGKHVPENCYKMSYWLVLIFVVCVLIN